MPEAAGNQSDRILDRGEDIAFEQQRVQGADSEPARHLRRARFGVGGITEKDDEAFREGDKNERWILAGCEQKFAVVAVAGFQAGSEELDGLPREILVVEGP